MINQVIGFFFAIKIGNESFYASYYLSAYYYF